MAVEVMRTTASVGSWIRGSGTVSTETLPVPCHVKARMVDACPLTSRSTTSQVGGTYADSGHVSCLRRVRSNSRDPHPAVVSGFTVGVMFFLAGIYTFFTISPSASCWPGAPNGCATCRTGCNGWPSTTR
ncbi:hypothetical protein GCM10010109_51960 [Actinoplanes campanulatus]|nr:hypothetical protein GCM10010109_51960 [Actinoplanes campanulatus]GID41346.1 hypothetical protein Aca09nite_78520 [Actinoplanes campanulatus]